MEEEEKKQKKKKTDMEKKEKGGMKEWKRKKKEGEGEDGFGEGKREKNNNNKEEKKTKTKKKKKSTQAAGCQGSDELTLALMGVERPQKPLHRFPIHVGQAKIFKSTVVMSIMIRALNEARAFSFVSYLEAVFCSFYW